MDVFFVLLLLDYIILSTPKPKAFNIKTKCIYKNFLLYYRTEGSFCIF